MLNTNILFWNEESIDMTRNQSYDDDDSSSRKMVKTCHNGGAAPWSDLNHHVLFLVMMQLGVVDFFSFSGVCKSWRSLAVSNRNTFMASKPPMSLRICWRSYKKPCYLKDLEGRKFKTILPRFAGGVCIGLTCGYLILFKRKTRDFWLVNPVTRHELNFPDFPIIDYDGTSTQDLRVILVFSLSRCGWVVVVFRKCFNDIWFSIAGKGAWNHVSHTSAFIDAHAFKGKLYTLNTNPTFKLSGEICELRLNPEPKLTLLETKNSLKPCAMYQELASSGENLYVMDYIPEGRYRFQELNFDEKKWVSREKRIGEYEFFLTNMKHGVSVELEYDRHGPGLLLGHNAGDMLTRIEVENETSFSANMWYFPHKCLNVDIVDE